MRRLRKLEIALGVIEKYDSDVYTLQRVKEDIKRDIEVMVSDRINPEIGKAYIFRGCNEHPAWEEVEEDQ